MVQSITRRRILRVLLGVAVALASSPLGLIAANSFLGLCSLLVAPLLATAVFFTLSTRDARRRAWWFGFTFSLGVCLPLCPRVEQLLFGLAHYLQRLSQEGRLSLSQRVIEPALLVLIVLCPLAAACLLGMFGGRIARSFVRAPSPGEDSSSNRRWQFSTRELLVGVGGACLLLAWILAPLRSFQAVEERTQSLFAARFKGSFMSGEVNLLGEPILDEQQGSLMPESGYRSFRPRDVNEYRVIAPIAKDGKERWAVWAYTCNGGRRDYVYQYGYAEAASEGELPKYPFPAKRYIEGTWELIDGVPTTAGPSATAVSVTSPARTDQPIVLRASAPPGTVCELLIFPSDAVTTPLAPMNVGQSKVVQWSFQVGPQSAGYSIAYQLRCIEQRGTSRMVSTTRGNVDIAAPQSK